MTKSVPSATAPAPRPVHRSRECFVCGTDNAAGLDLGMTWDGTRCRGDYTPRRLHRGYGNVLHGGILCGLLDEAICVAVGERIGGKVVTVRLEVTFHRPVLVERAVVVEGWLVRSRGRFHYGAGQVADQATGKVCTRGRMTCILLPEERASTFQGR